MRRGSYAPSGRLTQAHRLLHLPGRLHATPRFYLLLIAALCVGFSLSCGLTQLRSRRVEGRLAALYEERLRLDEQLKTLGQRLEYVQSDAYVQRVARDELNMLYPGEIRYIAG